MIVLEHEAVETYTSYFDLPFIQTTGRDAYIGTVFKILLRLRTECKHLLLIYQINVRTS